MRLAAISHRFLLGQIFKNSVMLLASGAALVIALAGCGKSPPSSEAAAPRRKLYWIQPLKGHPVHQLTQIGFRAGAAKAGYEAEIVGTDGPDIGGTLALAEQALARGDAAGIAIWTGNPASNPFIEKAGKAGIPVILPHFPVPEGSVPGAAGVISCDPSAYAAEAAREIGKAIVGKGAVAITQGSFNTTENLVAKTFASTMHEEFPAVRVLEPVEESFDTSTAISRAVGILQANSDVTAAFSTTGGGPVAWSNACHDAGRKVVIVGMDYTRVNLDLVRDGKVFAVIGQPLWEESFGSAELLAKAAAGEKLPWWTKLPAPFITKDKLEPFYALLDKVEKAITR
jgi:ribose transport system substrate-binding protein